MVVLEIGANYRGGCCLGVLCVCMITAAGSFLAVCEVVIFFGYDDASWRQWGHARGAFGVSLRQLLVQFVVLGGLGALIGSDMRKGKVFAVGWHVVNDMIV